MRDDLAAPNLGKAKRTEYEAPFFWQSYRTIEQWMSRVLSKGPISATKVDADDVAVGNSLTAKTVSTTGSITAAPASGIAAGFIRSANSHAQLVLDKGIVGAYSFIDGRYNNKIRWRMILGEASAEDGSPLNTGSNFILQAYDDAGTGNISNPIFINRSDGIVVMNKGATVGTLLNLTTGQVKFPATNVPSTDPNTLDGYEENTWVPDINFAGAGVGITYSANRYGGYTLIGGHCFFSTFIQLTSKGTSVGAARLTLPLAATTAANGGYCAVACGYYTGMALPVASYPGGYVQAGQSYALLNAPSTAASHVALTDAHFTNASVLMISGHYRVA